MTNFFTKLIGKSRSTMTAVAQNVLPADAPATNLISQELFVDNQPPNAVMQPNASISPVSQFINANYYNSGLNDGYEYHSSDVLKNKQDYLCAQFRMVLEKEIQKTLSEIKAMEISLARLGELFQNESNVLRIQISEKQNFVSEFKKQLALSVELEGIVAACIYQYRNGFQNGVIKYLDEQKYLNTFGIF